MPRKSALLNESLEALETLIKVGKHAPRALHTVPPEEVTRVPELLRHALPALLARTEPLDIRELSALSTAVRLDPGGTKLLWHLAFFVDEDGSLRCDATWTTHDLDAIVRNHMGVPYQALVREARREPLGATIESRIAAAAALDAALEARREKRALNLVRAGRSVARRWSPEDFVEWLDALATDDLRARVVDMLLTDLRGQALVNVVSLLASSEDPRFGYAQARLGTDILEKYITTALRVGRAPGVVAALRRLDLVSMPKLSELSRRFPAAVPYVLRELLADRHLSRETALSIAQTAIPVDEEIARRAISSFLRGSPRWIRYYYRKQLTQAYRRTPKLKPLIDAAVSESPPAAEYLARTPVYHHDGVFVRPRDCKRLGTLIELPWDPDDPAQRKLEEEWALAMVPKTQTRGGSVRARRFNPHNNRGIDFGVVYFPGSGLAYVDIDDGVDQGGFTIEGVYSISEAFKEAKAAAQERQDQSDFGWG